MKAAVVEAFDRPPVYRDFAEPVALEGEVLVTTRAAAKSQLVKAQAAGRHYSSTTPPFVPGADGVGQLADGQRVYFAFPRTPVGSMAECVAVRVENTVALPDGIDELTVAAIANPGMSSVAALRERAHFSSGESILVNGATGASGRLAIQIARLLGAGRVIATSRNPAAKEELLALGADAYVPLSLPQAELTARFRKEIADGIDVVLDYVWGASAEALFTAASGHGSSKAAHRIRYINIGSLGGPSLTLPAAALRSSGLEMMGSGLGSVSHAALVRCVGDLLPAIHSGTLRINASEVPLSAVESAWAEVSEARMVFRM